MILPARSLMVFSHLWLEENLSNYNGRDREQLIPFHHSLLNWDTIAFCKFTADSVFFIYSFLVQKLLHALGYPCCHSQMLLDFYCILPERLEDHSGTWYSGYRLALGFCNGIMTHSVLFSTCPVLSTKIIISNISFSFSTPPTTTLMLSWNNIS